MKGKKKKKKKLLLVVVMMMMMVVVEGKKEVVMEVEVEVEEVIWIFLLVEKVSPTGSLNR